MNENYPPTFVDATADDILAALRDMYRHDPDVDPNLLLTRDSTIAEWREACDLLPWAEVAEAMNASWSVSIPMEEWREVLEPAKRRRLGGVCDLLARHAKTPRVRPARILGSVCATAGAFLTIRSILVEAGADVSDVAPSTLLHEYTRCYPVVFVERVSRLAPGALPRLKMRAPVQKGLLVGAMIGAVGLLVGRCADLPVLTLCSGLAALLCYLGTWTIGQLFLPASVEFEGLRTFRDLSVAIVAGARR